MFFEVIARPPNVFFAGDAFIRSIAVSFLWLCLRDYPDPSPAFLLSTEYSAPGLSA
jgi:hypothetical protein